MQAAFLDAARERAEREVHAGECAALAVELLHALFRLTLAAHSRKGTRLPEPLSLPRPWQAEPSPVKPAPDALAALARVRGRAVR